MSVLNGDSKKKNWYAKMFASFIVPAIIILIRPLEMNVRQALVSAALILVITWWSTKLVNKIIASSFLLGAFAIFSSAPLKTVFSFPLSETFVLIILSYLFSQGIKNSRLAERALEPLLSRYINTPVKAFGSIILVFILTIYVIPQPLARLIIIANIYHNHLKKTNIPKRSVSVIMLSIFNFYVAVNMMAIDADLILNSASAGFAGIDITNGQWMSYMTVPTLAFSVVMMGLICLIFRKDVFRVRFEVSDTIKAAKPPMSGWDKITAIVVIGTVLLWAISGLFGDVLTFTINPTIVTLVGTLILFALGTLKLKDLRAIDVTTIIFISAAFSIGGVMKACGIADIVFLRVTILFPDTFSLRYIVVIILVSMGMHLILGSNTTTLSVVLPGLVMIGEGVIPATATLFICYTSLACHYLLPFHSVGMMIGSSNEYFETRDIVKLGSVLMVIIFIAVFVLFLPWWQLQGLL